ncbi:MAG: virulence factor [Parcubacteria group bacterium Athens0714_25]|nr:MAG: virulence factor [Parcubacteria group bacterium Athens0714_25]
MIQKIINSKLFSGSPVESVAGAALVISVAGILSRILGLVRDRILASRFGAGDVLDVYYAAFRVPDLVYNLLVVGALSAAFIPVFTRLITSKKKDEARKLSSGVITLIVLAVLLISSMLAIFAPLVMSLVTPGFSPEKMSDVVYFTRIMFLSPIFLGISAVFGGMLVSYKRFLVYSLAPIMYNIGIIIGAVFFVRIFGPVGLAWGVVLGAVLHMLIQYPAAKKTGFKYSFSLMKSVCDKNVRKVIVLMIPRSLGMAVNQINLLVITIFASTLAAGSLAVFNFANNIQSVPLGLFGVSFAVAAFPHLSGLAGEKSRKEFARVFSRTFRRIIFFVMPMSVAIFVLRAEIVRAVLGAGQFDWEDTVRTLQVLGILSLSLFAQSLIPLLARSFYAIHDTKFPFYIALVSEAVNIILVITLLEKYQVMGLAIAFSVSSILNMFLLVAILRKRVGYLDDKKIVSSFVKIGLASLFAGGVIQLGRYYLSNFISLDTLAEVLVQIVISGGMGVATFLLGCYYFGIEEFHDFKKSILVKIFGMPADIIKDPNSMEQ